MRLLQAAVHALTGLHPETPPLQGEAEARRRKKRATHRRGLEWLSSSCNESAPPQDSEAMAPRNRSALDELPRVAVTSAEVLRQWLLAHHASSRGAWAVTFKKDRGLHVPYDAVVRAVLCFGWVDSLPRALDARRSMLLLTPRKPGSGWSLANKERIKELEAAGLLHPSGAAVVAAARLSGAWDRLSEVSALVVPEDLAAALRALPPAEANFAAFPPSSRRGILEWLGNARTPPTREKRVREISSLAQRNLRANQWPRQG